MDMVMDTILKSIDDDFILNIDGTEQNCKSGAAALNSIDSAAVYAIQKIGVRDGKVYVEASGQTEVIAQKNREWMEEEKKRTGVEPGFF